MSTTTNSTTQIFIDGVLIDIDVRFWSASKVLRPEDLGLDPSHIVDAYKLGKKMLIPAEVIKKFKRIETRARALVDANSFKFPIGNARFIPKKRFSATIKKLKECQIEYTALVDDLISKYDQYRSEMLPMYQQAAEAAYMNTTPETSNFGLEQDPIAEKDKYINQFMLRLNTYYPPVDSLKTRFSLDWSVYEIAIPRLKQGSVSNIQNNLIAEDEYREQIHTKINGFVNEVVSVLRQETLEVCSKITHSITEGKVIKGKTIESLKKFIDRFKDLNFVGDSQIEDQLETLKKELLNAHTNTEISEDMELQAQLKRKLSSVLEIVQNTTDINSITGEYKRKINWQ